MARFGGFLLLGYNSAMTTLTPKQEAFAQAYVQTGSASEAYRTAYDASKMKRETVHRSAQEMMDHPKVSARIFELRAASETKHVMSRQEALERLSDIGRTNLHELVEFGTYEAGMDDDGNPVVQASWRFKDSALQDPKKMSAIAELVAGKDGLKIKLHSPLQAIQQIAKMQGWDKAPGLDFDLEIKRLTAEKMRLEVEAMMGKDKAETSGQNRPAEYAIAPDEPIPNEPIL